MAQPKKEFRCEARALCGKSRQARADLLSAVLKRLYPESFCALEYGEDPFRLLVMARLSAQCTDKRVNLVSKDLFLQYPTVYDMAKSDIVLLESIIRPCGLYKTKAKSIREFSGLLIERFDGKVPDTPEALLSLPGVGRKIANLILGDVHGKPAIVADTHCIRIAHRLGLTTKSTPLDTERQLDKLIAKQEQSDFCHRIVQFGRDTCTARGPNCRFCPIKEECHE